MYMDDQKADGTITDILERHGFVLEWEDQEQSSALYIKRHGQVVGVRANVAVLYASEQDHTSNNRKTWAVRNCWEEDVHAPKYRGRVGQRIGILHATQADAKAYVDIHIASGSWPLVQPILTELIHTQQAED